jgi:hypothetical protein
MTDHDEQDQDTVHPEPAGAERLRDGSGAAREPAKVARREPELPDDVEELKAELRKACDFSTRVDKESRERRKRLEELEAAEERRAQEKLSEDERMRRQLAEEGRKRADAEARAAEAEARLRQREVDIAVQVEASKLFNEPDLVPRLIDPTFITVEDDGHIKGVKEAVKKLAEQRPSLLRPQATAGTPPRGDRGGPRPPRQGADDEIRESILKTGRYAPL